MRSPFGRKFVIRRLALSRPRLSWVAFAAALLALVSLVASAFLSAPHPSGLSARVEARSHPNGERPRALSGITPSLRDAVVATEDERLYRHHGVDAIGILQAIVRNGYVTAAEASSALAAPLPLRGRPLLPPITGTSFAARPNVQVGQLVTGSP